MPLNASRGDRITMLVTPNMPTNAFADAEHLGMGIIAYARLVHACICRRNG